MWAQMCIVPVTDDGRVIVERQYRYPVDRIITEIPAGKLNDKQEDPLLAAQRELREETGLTASHWESLGIFYPAPAYSDETIHMFLAKGLHQGAQQLDADEFSEVTSVPLAEPGGANTSGASSRISRPKPPFCGRISWNAAGSDQLKNKNPEAAAYDSVASGFFGLCCRGHASCALLGSSSRSCSR